MQTAIGFIMVSVKQITTRAAAVAAIFLTLAACDSGRTPSADQTAAAEGRVALADQQAAVSADTVVVYKSPTCGCCNNWVDHMRENGFPVVTHDMDNIDGIKRQLGVPAGRISCHTATVRGYTIEGHVPADLIRRMIDEKPSIRGLAVPGMPVGSPGMEGPFSQQYDVLSFDDSGAVSVYARR